MIALAAATFTVGLHVGVAVVASPVHDPPGPAIEDSASPTADAEMTLYQLVLLFRGPQTRPMGEREIVRLQEEHLAYLGELLEADRAVVFGPVDGGERLRGVVVLDVGSVDAAREAMDRDPWVRAGRLRAEVHAWWAPAGVLRKPGNILHQSTCMLGVLLRPADAPDLPADRLREVQAGHRANIIAMADSGILVMAGPVEGDGELRGILVFRDVDPARIREAVARDPAVKAGRLGMKLYPWNVPRGSLPPS